MLARLDTAGRMQSYTCAKIMLFGENTKQKTLQNDKCHKKKHAATLNELQRIIMFNF